MSERFFYVAAGASFLLCSLALCMLAYAALHRALLQVCL